MKTNKFGKSMSYILRAHPIFTHINLENRLMSSLDRELWDNLKTPLQVRLKENLEGNLTGSLMSSLWNRLREDLDRDQP